MIAELCNSAIIFFVLRRSWIGAESVLAKAMPLPTRNPACAYCHCCLFGDAIHDRLETLRSCATLQSFSSAQPSTAACGAFWWAR